MHTSIWSTRLLFNYLSYLGLRLQGAATHTVLTIPGGRDTLIDYKKTLSSLILAAMLTGCGGESDNSDDAVTIAARKKKTAPITTQPAPTPTPTPAPPPPTTTSPLPSPTLAGAAAIPSNFDFQQELVPAWGTGGIPESGVPDVVGAFRFICMPGHLKKDDPIVFPGQPGKAHLHQFFGNMSADAYSTYESLRASGESSCMSPVNRSAYWMPAMLDGVGNVVRPDYVTIYYKRRPITDPKCDPATSTQAEGKCVNLPNGLKFVFGFNWVDPSKSPTGAYYYNCDGNGAKSGTYADIDTAMANCPVGSKIGALIGAPSCWDGKNLVSPDGRSHVSYASYGWWGYLKCPDTHPYVIPTFTMGVWYTVDANLKTWHLSSDSMNPGGKRGSSFHADFMMAWDPEVKKMWHDHCIDKLLNCSGGDLGNGKMLKQSFPFSWNANPRLVPIPS